MSSRWRCWIRQTGKLVDFPDDRTRADQSADAVFGAGVQRGWEAYVREHGVADGACGAGNREQGTGNSRRRGGETGNAVVVYGFDAGRITPERLIPIPLQKLDGTRRTKLTDGVEGAMGIPYPAAIAVVLGADGYRHTTTANLAATAERLLVADNLSDDVLLIDATTGVVDQAVRSVGERYGAGDLSDRAGSIERRQTCICGVVERERGGGARSGERQGGAEAGAVEAERSGEAGDASVRVGGVTGWEDAVCGAGQP